MTYPPNINIWLVSQFWYPRVCSLIPFIDVDYSYSCINLYTRPTLVGTLYFLVKLMSIFTCKYPLCMEKFLIINSHYDLQVDVFFVADGSGFWFICERGGIKCLGASLKLVYQTYHPVLLPCKKFLDSDLNTINCPDWSHSRLSIFMCRLVEHWDVVWYGTNHKKFFSHQYLQIYPTLLQPFFGSTGTVLSSMLITWILVCVCLLELCYIPYRKYHSTCLLETAIQASI